MTTDQWKKLVGKGVRRPKRHCLEIQNYRSGERERERERERGRVVKVGDTASGGEGGVWPEI